LLNTNADTIATKVAIEMSKYYNLRLLYCFDKSGVLENNKVIKRINYDDYLNLLKNKTIKDGMIPKIENAFDSIKNGVKKVYIGDINIFENPNNSTEICLS
jgi:acetylglutamate kinase